MIFSLTEPLFIPPNIETPECGMDRRGRLRERTRNITWGHAHKDCAQGFVQSQCSDTQSTDITLPSPKEVAGGWAIHFYHCKGV